MYDHTLTPIRVAAYCRVSTEHEDQINSLTNQRQYFADYITGHKNWILDHIFFDEGISGTQAYKRSGFCSMIEAARYGSFDLIITKEVSRFARNTVDALCYTRQLKEWGVGVLFTLDNIDTRDCDGELRLTLMAGIAQEESRKTSERVKWGQTRSMEQGVVFGRDLFGYHVTNGKLSVNQEESPVICDIFHQYTDEHKSISAIAQTLNERSISPKYSTLWSPSVIYRILHNEKYVGDLCQKKSCTPNYLTHKKITNPDASSLIYIRDHHTPIIDRTLWNRTQNQLRERSRSVHSNTRYSTRYWCSGLILCGLCREKYVSRTKRRKDHSIYHAWRCGSAALHGRCKNNESKTDTGCSNISINEQALLTCVNYVFAENSLTVPNVDTYREYLEDITIYPDSTLSIRLKNIPWSYQLTIHTRGRLDTYSTEILSCKRIKCFQ